MRRSLLALLGLFACRSTAVADTGRLIPTAAARDAPPAAGYAGEAPLAPAAPPAPPAALDSVATDWCIEGLSVLDEDVCYVLPPLAEGKPRRLLIYLHGIVPPLPTSPQKRTVESVVFHASVRSGAAGLVPRGRRGIGPGVARDWWAWPTSPATHAELTPSIVARWVAAKAKLEAIAGAPFERTYLAGSSNGAYFLTALALRGDLEALSFPVDGFGAMSGGTAAGRQPEQLAGVEPRPFYVGFGAHDEETSHDARSLVAALQSARWPVRVAEHPLGHGANEVYVDEAFEFWDATDRAGR
jgi:predicted esterase